MSLRLLDTQFFDQNALGSRTCFREQLLAPCAELSYKFRDFRRNSLAIITGDANPISRSEESPPPATRVVGGRLKFTPFITSSNVNLVVAPSCELIACFHRYAEQD